MRPANLTLAAAALATVATLGAAAPRAAADAAPIGAHVECYLGKDKQPVQQRRPLDRELTCRLVIDQGEPPPSAHAELTLAQPDEPGGRARTADQFVPEDPGDGVYYPFPDAFRPGADFKACKDVTVIGRVVDGEHELWRGQAALATQCKPARKLPLVFGCHWDGELICVLQTRNLKTKVPAGVIGRVTLGAGVDTTAAAGKVVVDAFSDYPDDTYAVEARFTRADLACPAGAAGAAGAAPITQVRAAAETAQGQLVFAATITAPGCP